jgi:integrase
MYNAQPGDPVTAPLEMPLVLLGRVKGPAPLVRPGPRHRRSKLPCKPDLTNDTPPGLLLRLLTEQLEAAVKDKSYQRTPIGQQVRDFLDVLHDDGKPRTTLDTYERPLAWLALEFEDLPGVAAFCCPEGLRYLRDFRRRRFGDTSTETQRTYTAALRSFGNWAEDEGLAPYNPFRKLKLPRSKQTLRVAHESGEMQQLLSRQNSLRDEAALGLFIALGLRKNDVRTLRIRDIDLSRRYVYLRHRKGGQVIALPIEYPWLEQSLYLHFQGDSRYPAEYLLYPKKDRMRPMDPSTLHRWFKHCLERADLPAFPLHELRHTAADEIFRRNGGNLVAAQMLLGHKNIETTRRYLHPSDDDLRAWMQTEVSAPSDKSLEGASSAAAVRRRMVSTWNAR